VSPFLPGPTIPYPSMPDAQSSADWCASTLAAAKSHIAAQASSMAAIHTWLMQRQWLTDGGNLASYPIPVASGPAVAIGLYGSSDAQAPDSPSVAFR